MILHRRGSRTDLHPPPDLALEPGDHIVVCATLEVLNRFRERGGRPGSGRA